MPKVRLSRLPDVDLLELLAFGDARFGEPISDSYYDSFDEAFDVLGRHPNIGAAAFPDRPRIRVLHHRRHRIFYEQTGEGVLILRILHHARDAERHLK